MLLIDEFLSLLQDKGRERAEEEKEREKVWDHVRSTRGTKKEELFAWGGEGKKREEGKENNGFLSFFFSFFKYFGCDFLTKDLGLWLRI